MNEEKVYKGSTYRVSFKRKMPIASFEDITIGLEYEFPITYDLDKAYDFVATKVLTWCQSWEARPSITLKKRH